MGSLRQDLVGKQFGRLAVEKYAGYTTSKSGKRILLWECRCECGNVIVVRGNSLKTGSTKSCGCYRKELGMSSKVMTKQIHGDSSKNSRLYRIWLGIKTRCTNSKVPEYQNYGGRGIQVCSEWVNDYSVFREWAISSGYSNNLSIDRIDTDGNYEPDNCKWSTNKEQQNNKRTNRILRYDNKEMTLKQWSEVICIPNDTLWRRLESGWSVERTLTQPLRKQKNNRKY